MATLEMENDILFQNRLNVWSIRGMMLLSLSVQIILAIAAPFRISSRTWAPVIVWCTYILSDSVAIYTTGLISKTFRTSKALYYFSTDIQLSQVNLDILALWASILLVLMGGPHTVTSYSLEDNSLWLRHVVRLIGQLAIISYVLFKTLPGNDLLVPTLLLLMMGVIKYLERTRALFLASLENLKDSVRKRKINKLPQLEISVSYYFYERFRGMILDAMPRPSELKQSREFFMQNTAEQALKLISGELNMMYDELYTRVKPVISNLGILISYIYGSSIIVALVLFFYSKENYGVEVDVIITYCLLAGLLFIHFSRGFMSIFSATARVPEIRKGLISYSMWFSLMIVSLRITLKPWSKRMGAFNLLDCTIKKHCLGKNMAIRCCRGFLDDAVNLCGLTDRLDKLIHTSTNCLQEDLWENIFKGLKQKALEIDGEETAREVYESKGETVLQAMNLSAWDESNTKDFDFFKRLLCWHIATEICYNVYEDRNNKKREWSKILSDYLMYLLIHRQRLTAAIVYISHERYDSTCLEVKKLVNKLKVADLKKFCTWALTEQAEADMETGGSEVHEKSVLSDALYLARILGNCCNCAGALAQQEKPDMETGERGVHEKSVLSDAINLAKNLEKCGNKWEIIFKFWMEMLSYAAGHCRGNEHASTVSKGGELVTHVWLLMAHFGITARWPKD